MENFTLLRIFRLYIECIDLLKEVEGRLTGTWNKEIGFQEQSTLFSQAKRKVVNTKNLQFTFHGIDLLPK